jgi:DNA-binding Xre family transcriptional regulator
MGERITRDRPLSDAEAERYQRIRDQVTAELSDIRRRARTAKPRILLKHAIKQLREERQRQGLSLADIQARSGIDRGTLSKLENDEDPNVTMNTLMRYAQAVGKVVLVQLDEAAPV